MREPTDVVKDWHEQPICEMNACKYPTYSDAECKGCEFRKCTAAKCPACNDLRGPASG